MSRIPLALKYRPRTFDEVVGQRHVTETLRNALRRGRVGAAYLFAGPRGSGKTTTARLLARAVNCTDLKDGEPCGECEICRSILSGRSLDVMEIDAASNRGIEDVRELRERVGYAAVQGQKKIYIVDEVHMLSKDAFNALLKTIEEPPPHVVFVFATTDPQKVLPTVVSRCQRFDFKRIPLKDVEARIREICTVEGYSITSEAVFLIAKRADGSLRDALGMLDQVISLGEDGELDAQRVRDVLGLAGLDLYLAATDSMRRRDPAAAIGFVRGLVEDGTDLLDFYGGLYEHLRSLMLFALPDGAAAASVPADFHAAYRETAEAIGFEDLLRATQILTDYEFAFRGTSHPEYMLEFLLVRLALLDRTADVAALLEEVRAGSGEGSGATSGPRRAPRQDGGASGARTGPGAGASRRGQARPPAGRALSEPGEEAASPGPRPEAVVALAQGTGIADDLPGASPSPATSDSPPAPGAGDGEAADAWEAVLQSVSRKKASLAGMLAGLDRPAIEGDELVLSVPGDRAFVAEALRDGKNRALLEDVLASLGPGPQRVRLEVGSVDRSPVEPGALRRLDRNDPLVQRVLEVFDADFVG
jgi:DNA polymerase-3 subunit gamma/tau